MCLSFNLVPKLIQISFQTMEQKLVQHCETKVDADACKASYVRNTESTMGLVYCYLRDYIALIMVSEIDSYVGNKIWSKLSSEIGS